MTTSAYIGCGAMIILAIAFVVWHRKKNLLGIDKCLYRGDKNKNQNFTIKISEDKGSAPAGCFKEPRLSYYAKMNIILVISLVVIMPLFFFILSFCLTMLNKIMKDNAFSKNEQLFVSLVIFIMLASLYIICIHTFCICFHKCLPKYFTKGRVVYKNTVIQRVSRGRHSNIRYENGYFWINSIFGADTRKVCVLTIAQKDGSIEFYAPQKIYDHVQLKDLVNVTYNVINSYYIIVDITHAH